MSKRAQRGTCQQQQPQQPLHQQHQQHPQHPHAASAAERQEGQTRGAGQPHSKLTPQASENLDEYKRTMTSLTRKRPRLGLQTSEPAQNVDEQQRQAAHEPKLPPEQQEMIDLPKGGHVQELRVSMRRGRAQQQRSATPPQHKPDADQTEARRQPAKPLTAANATSPQPPAKQNICAACKRPIRERYLLMALDKHWHEDCLKCACCDCRLGEVGSSLFTHSDKILCRRDFLRIFGQHGHCAACKRSIPPYELVMRANELAYHMDCFACQQCQYRFCVGDRFYLAEAHKIICLRCHNEQQQPPPPPPPPAATRTAPSAHSAYDQNHHLQTSDSSTGSTASATSGRLDGGPKACPETNGHSENFGTAEDAAERQRAAEEPDERNGGTQTEPEEQVKSPDDLPAQQQVAPLQPGDQKQACAV